MPTKKTGRPMLRARARPVPNAATYGRAWTIAQQLRARRGWWLDDAFVARFWSVRAGAAAFEVSAHVSLIFRGACMVIALEPAFPKTTSPASAEAAVQQLRASLGDRYRKDPPGGSLVRVVRTEHAKELLAEIAHVEHVLGGRAVRRFGPSPRSPDGRRWHVVEALRASSWPIAGLTLGRMVGDKQRALWASIGAVVDSADGRPGITAHLAGWVPKTTKRWTQFRADTIAGLAADGFRAQEPDPRAFFLGRWVPGLNDTRALKQADMFDQLIEAGADVVGAPASRRDRL